MDERRPSLTRRRLLPRATAYKEELLRLMRLARFPDKRHAHFAPFFRAAGRCEKQPFREANIVGIGFGVKETAGRMTGQVAVRVYVSRKISRMALSRRQRIPETVNGLPTDVVRIGRPRLHGRPVAVGASVRHVNGAGGSLGCIVERNADDRLYVLSASHVFAPSGAAVGDSILEPAIGPGVALATLVDFEPLKVDGSPNPFDGAIARLNRNSDIVFGVPTIGDPRPEVLDATLYESVRKFGATSLHTIGVVTDAAADVAFMLGGEETLFQDVIEVVGCGGEFSQGGDSGAMVVDALTNKPIGLIIGGRGTNTFVSPLRPVLKRFTATLTDAP